MNEQQIQKAIFENLAWRAAPRPAGRTQTMSADILQFPRHRGRDALPDVVIVELTEDGWLLIYNEQGYPHSSRDEALRSALAIADQANVAVIVKPSHSRRKTTGGGA
jgi:hypothetical protein